MDVIFLTSPSIEEAPLSTLRAIGSYQLEHFIGLHGYDACTIDFVERFTEEELTRALMQRVTSSTLAIGLSTVFLTPHYFTRNGARCVGYRKAIMNSMLAVKRAYPSVKLIAGGLHSDVKNEAFDCLVFGIGEAKLLAYLDYLRGKNPFLQAERNELNQVMLKHDQVGRPKFDIATSEFRFKDHHYIAPGEALPIEISRGCIFKCSFCAFPLNGKRKLDYLRSARLIADEMRYNHDKWGTVDYYFCDDTFNDSPEKLRAIAEEVERLPFKVSFISYARADLLASKPETIELVERIGVRSFFFGVETFNEAAAKVIKKGFSGRRMRAFLESLRARWEPQGRNFQLGLIAGLPRDTLEAIHETQRYLLEAQLCGWRWNALGINDPKRLGDKLYTSDFDLHAEDYGFVFPDPERPFVWTNEYTSSHKMTALVSGFNREITKRATNTATVWQYACFVNAGLGRDLIDKVPATALRATLKPTVDQFFTRYKAAVHGLSLLRSADPQAKA